MTNILWYDQVGMADLAQVGGKNASLGEMVSNLSGAGVRVPGRLRDDRRRLPRVPRRRRPLRPDPPHRRGARRHRCRGAGAGRRERAGLDPGAALPAHVREGHPRGVRDAGRQRSAARVRVVGGALQRHCRRPSGCLVRRSAGDLPEHQRHREHPLRDPERVRLAVQRPGHRVPRAPRVRPPRRRAVGGRAADGAIGCRCLRRPVHRRHRVGLRPRGVHHQLVRTRRGGRAGRRQPGRVLRLQAGAAGRSSGDPEALGGGEGREDGLRARHATWAAAPSSPMSRRRIARASASRMPRWRNWAGRR